MTFLRRRAKLVDNDLRRRRVLLLNWRDTHNPEGGGAELYLEKIAEGLAARGCRVTHLSAAYAGAPPSEVVRGVRYLRRGSKLTVYLAGLLEVARTRRRTDLVVDVQNGLPFLSPIAARCPVVLLVHHVHREQWPVVYPGLTGRVGWWIESRLSPRLYRRAQYVAVSQATREELIELGVAPARIAVVHNGTDPVLEVTPTKTAAPSICVVGRLVPHKRVEQAIEATSRLRRRIPGLTLTIVGSGWWEAELHELAARLEAEEFVSFVGHVDEVRKQEIYEQSWVMALPSLKEGWGLVIGEAAMHGTPCVAYRSAGGTRESIQDGVSGTLVDTQDEFDAALERVLTDDSWRTALAAGARELTTHFTWDRTQESFSRLCQEALAGELVADEDGTDTV